MRARDDLVLAGALVFSLLVFSFLVLSLVAACGGKIAPDTDAGLAGTCGAHQTRQVATCATSDEVTCSDGTYVVACDCAVAACICTHNGIGGKSVPFPQCACTPAREAISAVYVACGFPY